MALVIESVSSNSGNNQSSITVTAPTGITTGDLLLFVVQGHDTVSTPSGFTLSESHAYNGPISEGGTYVYFFYKYAVLADESAVNYTATFATSDGGGAGILFRISGVTTIDPILSITKGEAGIASTGETTGTRAVATSQSRPGDSLLLMYHSVGTTDNSITFNTSNYTITSTDSNPTWTEQIDVVYTCNGDSDTSSKSFAIATAPNTDNSTITQFSFDWDEGSGNGMGTIFGLVVITEIVNETGTHTLISPNVTVNNANATSGASGTHALTTTTTSFFGTTGSVRQDPVWIKEDKPTSIWTNESK